jgi:Spy/CpxP family protein refolding chaperone
MYECEDGDYVSRDDYRRDILEYVDVNESQSDTIKELRAEIERWRDATARLRMEMEAQSLRANTAEAEISRLNSLLSGRPLA